MKRRTVGTIWTVPTRSWKTWRTCCQTALWLHLLYHLSQVTKTSTVLIVWNRVYFSANNPLRKPLMLHQLLFCIFYTNWFSIQLFKSLNIEWDFNFTLLRRQEMKTVIFCCCCCFGLGEFELVTSGSCSPHVRNQEDFRNNFGLYSLFVHHVFNFN